MSAVNDNDPAYRERAKAKLRDWVLAGCPEDDAALDALEAIDLSDAELEQMFRTRPRGAATVPHGGAVR